MRNNILSILLLILSLSLNAQDTIPTVKIGDQIWMIKNLDVSTFRNGDTIPEAQTNEAWQQAGENGKPAWCYLINSIEYGQKYGKLYNWYAVNDPRGIAPKGFHVPSFAEFDSLVSYLGGKENSFKKLKSTEGWAEEGNGTNESGFIGIPCGNRSCSEFESYKLSVNYWSSSEFTTIGYVRRFTLSYNDYPYISSYILPCFGFSVRCLRD